MLLRTPPTYLSRKHRDEPAPPEPDGLVVDVNASFMELQREPHIVHHCRADDLSAGFSEVDQGAFGRRGKLGNRVSRGQISALLRIPIYIGKIRHKTQVRGEPHEPILDETVWTPVQAKLQAASARPRGRAAVTTPRGSPTTALRGTKARDGASGGTTQKSRQLTGLRSSLWQKAYPKRPEQRRGKGKEGLS